MTSRTRNTTVPRMVRTTDGFPTAYARESWRRQYRATQARFAS